MFNRKQQQQIKEEIRQEVKWLLLSQKLERIMAEQEALLNKMTLRESGIKKKRQLIKTH